MKGDYSQPGLMPGRYLKKIELPSAYLVYAVERRLRGRAQLTPAAHRFASLIPIGRSLGRFSGNYSTVLLKWDSEQSLGKRKSLRTMHCSHHTIQLINGAVSGPCYVRVVTRSNHRLRRHFEVLRPSSRQTVEETRKIRRF